MRWLPAYGGARRRRVTVVGVLGALVLLAGCGARVEDVAVDAPPPPSCVDTSSETIKVGFLNSRSGTMAISENTVHDSLSLAAEQINAQGGVLGKQLEVISEDGASEPAVFAERAQKLIRGDCVAAVFGAWTSASRKAILPVVESTNGLLFYPVQYEGMESSPNIFYTGATTNQQIVPGLDYLRQQGARSLFLVGSDYVFPQTANTIIRAYAGAHGMTIVGEEYAPLGHTDFSTIATKVRHSGADAVFNTLNGDSNVAFFKEYRNLGLTPERMPVLSVSIAEEEISGIGVDNIVGQPVAWNYYQTLESPRNAQFVEDFTAAYGDDRVTSDPMEAAYTSLLLWRALVEQAGSFDVEAVREAASAPVAVDAPEGTVTVDGENQHVAKTARIGVVEPDGLIRTTWSSPGPIEPDPFLRAYPWAADLAP